MSPAPSQTALTEYRFRLLPYLIALLLAALSASAPAPTPQPAPPPGTPAGQLLLQAADTPFSMRVLIVAGSPEEMGRQLGRQGATAIRQAAGQAWRACGLSRPDSWRACRARVAALRAILPADLLEEARGLALGAGVSDADILLLNSVAAGAEGAAFAAWGQATLDEQIFLGAASPLALTDPAAALWVMRRPAMGRPTMLLSRPGWLGGWAGASAERLVGIAIAAASADRQDAGLPAQIALRLALEEAAAPEEGITTLLRMRHAGGAQMLFAGERSDAAGLELSAHQYRRLPAALDTLITVGLYRDAGLSQTQTAALPAEEIAAAQARWDRGEALARANVGWIGADKALLALHELAPARDSVLLLFAPAAEQIWIGPAGNNLLNLHLGDLFSSANP